MKLLLCRPDYYGIEYEINPWMDIKRNTDHAAAMKQWYALCDTIKKCGAQIELVPPQKGVPDLVFTANAGLLYQNKMILANFKPEQRRKEIPYYKTWFEQAGFTLLNVPKKDQSQYYFEGEGDALFAGDKLFVGYGMRSEHNYYQQASYLKQDKLIYCELVNPYFYHLDTCFCPLNERQALWYPAAFSKESQQKMAAAIDLIPVIEEEAKCFACNAIVVDKQIILPAGCPEVTKQLEKLGFTVHACEMGEYIKAGGACKCLVLKLD